MHLRARVRHKHPIQRSHSVITLPAKPYRQSARLPSILSSTLQYFFSSHCMSSRSSDSTLLHCGIENRFTT